MKRRYIWGVTLFTLMLIIIYNISMPFNVIDAEINQGEIDLSGFDFDREGLINLEGEWAFYNAYFFETDDVENVLHGKPLAVDADTITFPGIWNTPKKGNLESLTGTGYGTYVLKVKLNPETTKMIGLKVGEFFSAYEFYWNNEKILASGQVGTSAENSKGHLTTRTAFVDVTEAENLLMIKVSNYQQDSGGAWGKIFIGSPEDIHFYRTREVGLEMFYIGLLFIMGWYHIMLALIHKKDRMSAIFGLYALTMGLRQMLVGTRLFALIFPRVGFSGALRLEYLTYYVGVLLFVHFIYLMYKVIFHRRLYQIVLAVGILECFIVLVTPPIVFSYLLPTFQLLTLILVVYTLYIVLRGIRFELEGSDIFFVGIIVVLFAAVNDILNVKGIIDTDYYMSLSMMVFIFCQAILIAKKNTVAYDEAIYYSEKSLEMNKALNELNASLEDIIAERTAELKKKNDALDQISKRDGLTGLYNHSAVTAILNEEIEFAIREGHEVCIAMLDIDYFKYVNDTFGHQVGDLVLSEISNVIMLSTREDDIVGRYGGEEFMVILPSTDLSTAIIVLEHLRTRIDNMIIGDENVHVTISGGVTVYTHGERRENFIRRADQYLYKAKDSGRNRIIYK